MKEYVIVDLCSGLGGFSEGARRRGWKVFRFEINREFASIPDTYIENILDLDPRDLPFKPDLLVGSPPCEKFSVASCWRWWPQDSETMKCIPEPETIEEMEIVKKVIEIKNEIKPKYFVIENPAGKMKEVLGPADVLTWWGAWGHIYLKPTHLWGIFPPIDWPPRPLAGTYQPAPRGSKAGVCSDTLTPAQRSLVPFNFSDTLVQAVEQYPNGPKFGEDLLSILPKWIEN